MFAGDKGPSIQRACALFNCFRYSDAEQQSEHESSRASESCLLVIKIRAFNAHTRKIFAYLLPLCSEPCMLMIKVRALNAFIFEHAVSVSRLHFSGR